MDVCSFLCSFPPPCSLISHWIINGTVFSAFLFLFVCVHCSRLIALSAFLPLFFFNKSRSNCFFFYVCVPFVATPTSSFYCSACWRICECMLVSACLKRLLSTYSTRRCACLSLPWLFLFVLLSFRLFFLSLPLWAKCSFFLPFLFSSGIGILECGAIAVLLYSPLRLMTHNTHIHTCMQARCQLYAQGWRL